MPKRVAVIDIGSNSIKLIIYQRTSRYGFTPYFNIKVKLELERVLTKRVVIFKKNAIGKKAFLEGTFQFLLLNNYLKEVKGLRKKVNLQ